MPSHIVRIAAILLFATLLSCLGTATQSHAADTAPKAIATQDSPAALPLLATGIYQAGLLADGRLLCVTYDGVFSTVELHSGVAALWAPDWDAQRDGFTDSGCGGFNWKLAVSPDGAHVALARGVGISHPDPDGDYLDMAVAILLCGPEGRGARCVGLAEVTDGGPPLDFTQDSSRLVGPWFFSCPPTAAGFAQYVASGFAANEALQFNYIETATGKGAYQADLAGYEFYDKAPLSDNIAYEGLDERGLSFASLMGGGEAGRYLPPEEHGWTNYEWVAPATLLLNMDDGSQLLVGIDGRDQRAPQAVWHHYASLPDGTCLFSNDRGRSVQYGLVDWRTLSIAWQVPRPDLARFAEPLGEDGWPARLDQWLPLRDSSGVLIISPEEGNVFLVKLSR